MTTAQINPPNTGIITATGTKGLLQWIQQTMPDFYRVLSPQLVSMARTGQLAGFGCADQSTLGAIYRGDFATRSSQLEGLGDYATYANTEPSTGTITTTLDVSNPASNPDFTIPADSTTSNAASVANSTASSGNIANAINSIAGAVTAGTLASAQIQANNSLLQTNLLRAQQGLPPLTATTNAAGFTTLGDSTTLLILGAAVLAVVMLSKKGSSSSAT